MTSKALNGKDCQNLNGSLSYRSVTSSVAARWTCRKERVKVTRQMRRCVTDLIHLSEVRGRSVEMVADRLSRFFLHTAPWSFKPTKKSSYMAFLGLLKALHNSPSAGLIIEKPPCTHIYKHVLVKRLSKIS